MRSGRGGGGKTESSADAADLSGGPAGAAADGAAEVVDVVKTGKFRDARQRMGGLLEQRDRLLKAELSQIFGGGDADFPEKQTPERGPVDLQSFRQRVHIQIRIVEIFPQIRIAS